MNTEFWLLFGASVAWVWTVWALASAALDTAQREQARRRDEALDRARMDLAARIGGRS